MIWAFGKSWGYFKKIIMHQKVLNKDIAYNHVLDKDMFVMLTKSKVYKIICMKLKDVLLSEYP